MRCLAIKKAELPLLKAARLSDRPVAFCLRLAADLALSLFKLYIVRGHRCHQDIRTFRRHEVVGHLLFEILNVNLLDLAVESERDTIKIIKCHRRSQVHPHVKGL